MNEEMITKYLISLGVDNAIWDMKKAGSANYAVDRSTNLIALIPDHIAYHQDETYLSN
jgi:hypothetical protein